MSPSYLRTAHRVRAGCGHQQNQCSAIMALLSDRCQNQGLSISSVEAETQRDFFFFKTLDVSVSSVEPRRGR